MSCATSQQTIAKTAGVGAGVSNLASKNGYTAGVTPIATIPMEAGRVPTSRKVKRKKKKDGNAQKRKTVAKKKDTSIQNGVTPKRTKQTPFFATAESKSAVTAQRRIAITDKFTQDELQALSVQLSYGAASVSRAIKEAKNRVDRGVGHSDPRPMDWAKQDQKAFRFLLNQLAQVRFRGKGYMDLSSLNNDEVVDLYEFAQFEAERHHRNIDHLTRGLSHLKEETADYMTRRHQLQAQFYTYLTDQMEPFITIDMLDDAQSILLDQ
ncbi:MAG: hypothetical protein AAF485_07175 [Chloroflexota bacterium]